MMDPIIDLLPVWFGLLAGMVVAAQVFTAMAKRIRQAKAQHAARQRRLKQASQALRERARATLALRREERQMEQEMMVLNHSIEEGEATAERERRSESQLYVFDERKNIGDHPYLMTIRHRDFNNLARHAPAEVTQSWQTGRRYMVWAAHEKMAVAKATQRFSQDKGYSVSEPEPFQGDPEQV